MKNIKILIKLKKQELDEKRKNLSIWLDHVNKLKEVLEMLDEELIVEQKIAQELGTLAYTYNDYYKLNREKRDLVFNEIQKYNKMIKNIQEQIFIDFTELKKYEITLDTHLETSLKISQRKQQNNLDEIAINQFIQKNQNES